MKPNALTPPPAPLPSTGEGSLLISPTPSPRPRPWVHGARHGARPLPSRAEGSQCNPRLAALRAAKAALLPRAAALAGEGRSYQEIAAALGIAKSTVCNWLRDRPLGRAAARSLGTPRMTARLAARYESLYHRAVREWNRSRTDRRTESVVTHLRRPAAARPPRPRSAPSRGSAAPPAWARPWRRCRPWRACTAANGRGKNGWRAKQPSGGRARPATTAAGKEDGLTRTVKTTMTPSGRMVRTVVTTRSDDGGLAALRDAQKVLDEKRLPWRRGWLRPKTRRRTRPRTRRCARQLRRGRRGRGTICLCRDAISPAVAVRQRCRTKCCKRGGLVRVTRKARPSLARRVPIVTAPSLPLAVSRWRRTPSLSASGSDAQSLANASGSDGAGSVNGGPAKKRRDWRKSFVPKDLRLRLDELSGVSRSATLPNELLQKRGRGKGKDKRRRPEVGGAEGRAVGAAGRDG